MDGARPRPTVDIEGRSRRAAEPQRCNGSIVASRSGIRGGMDTVTTIHWHVPIQRRGWIVGRGLDTATVAISRVAIKATE